MSQILILLRKSVLNYSRNRGAIVFTFLVPAILIYLFGHVFGLYGSDPGPRGIQVAVVNASHEPAAQQLIDALKAEPALRIITTAEKPDGTKRPLTEADVRGALHDNDYRYALILPADLIRDDQIGLRMKFLTNPRNDIEAQTVNGIVQKTIFSKVPQLLGQSLQAHARKLVGTERFDAFNTTIADTISRTFGGDKAEIQRRIEAGDFLNRTKRKAAEPADPTLRRLDATSAGTGEVGKTEAKPAARSNDLLSRVINFDTEQVAGKQVKNPMAARLVGGYAIMFLLFAVSNGARTLFDERESGIFQRLLSSPVRPVHIIGARFLFGILLGLVQITALFLAGRLFFGLEILPHLPALLAVSIAAAAACSAFGILVSAISPSPDAASGIATLIVLSMSAIGGAWFPISFMPEYIQRFSKLTLVYWSVEGFIDVLWAGRSFIEVLPKVGILAAIAAVVTAFSLWRFSRNKFFE
jgi:ABC-2 type transport system permease protein